MKKPIIVLFALILFTSKAWADGAEVTLIEGNTVIPIQNDKVQMVSEDVRISAATEERKIPHPILPFIKETIIINKGDKVIAKMNFQNLSNDDLPMKMGFPISNSATASAYYLKEFRVWINDQPVNFLKKPIKQTKDNVLTDSAGVSLYREMFVWDIMFMRNEKKTVRVEYIVQWGTNIQGNPIQYFEYVTRTGALWSGNIEKADFYIEVGKAILNESKGNKPRYRLDIRPRGFEIKNDYIEWHLTNWKPTEDISIAVNEVEQ